MGCRGILLGCTQLINSEQLGHRGRKDDPLYQIRQLLTKANERVDEKEHE